MSEFSPAEIRAFRGLAEARPGIRIVLIGARALAHWIPMGWRKTFDIDVSIPITTDEWNELHPTLSGWTAVAAHEAAWKVGDGVRIDVVPVGATDLAAGRIIWPRTGLEMNVQSFRHAFDRAIDVELEPGLSIGIAPLPVLVALKATAYMDQPLEREKDLADLAHILQWYPPEDDLRRFELEVIDRAYTMETAGCFILGREIASVLEPADRVPVVQVIERVREESDGGRARSVMLRQGPRIWGNDPRALLDRIEAVADGILFESE